MGSNLVAASSILDIESVSSKKFLDIQAAIGSRFTLKRVRDMIRTCSTPELSYVLIIMQNNAILFVII